MPVQAAKLSSMDLLRWAATNAPDIAKHIDALLKDDATNKDRAEALKGLIDVGVTLFPDEPNTVSVLAASAVTTQGWEEIVKLGLPILLELIRARRERRQGGSAG